MLERLQSYDHVEALWAECETKCCASSGRTSSAVPLVLRAMSPIADATQVVVTIHTPSTIGPMYPALVDVPLGFGDRELGYTVLKAFQALAMSAAAAPVYVWGAASSVLRGHWPRPRRRSGSRESCWHRRSSSPLC